MHSCIDVARMHGLGPCPKYVKFTCCAQFAVSRARIQGRPLEFYQKALWYIANNDLRPSNLATHRYVRTRANCQMPGTIYGMSALSMASAQAYHALGMAFSLQPVYSSPPKLRIILARSSGDAAAA